MNELLTYNPTITVTELSRDLGISPRQIQMLVSQGALPKHAKGKYKQGDCFSAYLAYKVHFGPHTFCGKNDPLTAEYAFDRFEYQRQHTAELVAYIHKQGVKIEKLEKQLKAI